MTVAGNETLAHKLFLLLLRDVRQEYRKSDVFLCLVSDLDNSNPCVDREDFVWMRLMGEVISLQLFGREVRLISWSTLLFDKSLVDKTFGVCRRILYLLFNNLFKS